MEALNTYKAGPDEAGRFGIYGGRFVAETLMPLVLDLEQAYKDARADPAFAEELDGYLKHYVGRPSPLYFAERLTEHFGGAKIYFKRDELNHTGAHKINNCLGQALLAEDDHALRHRVFDDDRLAAGRGIPLRDIDRHRRLGQVPEGPIDERSQLLRGDVPDDPEKQIVAGEALIDIGELATPKFASSLASLHACEATARAQADAGRRVAAVHASSSTPCSLLVYYRAP